MSDNNNQPLPHNIETEEGVLGSLLLGGDFKLLSITQNDFYSERNGYVFQACQTLVERNVSVNQITVTEELSRMGKLEIIGGAAYLSYLISSCPTHLDMTYYADIVSRLSFHRKLIVVGNKIADIGHKAEPDVEESVNKADNLLLELRKKATPSVIISPKDKTQRLLDRYLNLVNEENDIALSTGLIDLDRILGGGLFSGDLIIIGGRTGMGKTTLAQFIGNKIAQRNNVLVFSCEMDVESLGDRDMAGLVGVPVSAIRLGKYSDELFNSIMENVQKIENTNIYTYDETPITTAKIMQASLSLQVRKGLSAIIVDHIGLLDDDAGENRNITLGYISKKLKTVARTLKIPVIALHQLSRALGSREDKRPVLSDLRESGHLEEDADVVMFTYRDSYYWDRESWNKEFLDVEYPENITEIIVAKQRQGTTGIVKVLFDSKYQQFRDLVKQV